jgi:hypothetical protein
MADTQLTLCCGAHLGWHTVTCVEQMAKQRAPRPPEGAAVLVRDVANDYDRLFRDNPNVQHPAARLLHLADWLESLGAS